MLKETWANVLSCGSWKTISLGLLTSTTSENRKQDGLDAVAWSMT